jgi:hypothetical protein
MRPLSSQTRVPHVFNPSPNNTTATTNPCLSANYPPHHPHPTPLHFVHGRSFSFVMVVKQNIVNRFLTNRNSCQKKYPCYLQSPVTDRISVAKNRTFVIIDYYAWCTLLSVLQRGKQVRASSNISRHFLLLVLGTAWQKLTLKPSEELTSAVPLCRNVFKSGKTNLWDWQWTCENQVFVKFDHWSLLALESAQTEKSDRESQYETIAETFAIFTVLNPCLSGIKCYLRKREMVLWVRHNRGVLVCSSVCNRPQLKVDVFWVKRHDESLFPWFLVIPHSGKHSHYNVYEWSVGVFDRDRCTGGQQCNEKETCWPRPACDRV